MRISDWSSDVCSSDLRCLAARSCWPSGARAATASHRSVLHHEESLGPVRAAGDHGIAVRRLHLSAGDARRNADPVAVDRQADALVRPAARDRWRRGAEERSEEHTSELQSLMRISYAVFCWKKKR